jgi:hypothetical protein
MYDFMIKTYIVIGQFKVIDIKTEDEKSRNRR